MIVSMIQRQKDACSAAFELISGGERVGSAILTGRPGFRAGSWNIWFCGHGNAMKPGKRGMRSGIYYTINNDGEICVRHRNGGMFRPGYDFVALTCGGAHYEIFSVGCGREGMKSPVYRGTQQIALIENEILTDNDLHHYRVAAQNVSDAEIALLTCCFQYATGAYRAGVRVYRSVKVGVTVTKHSELLKKYDPAFMREEREREPAWLQVLQRRSR